LRFSHPQSDADVRLIRGSDLPLIRFDPTHLRSLVLDPNGYGAALTTAPAAATALPPPTRCSRLSP
jgi:hypothetical protein